MRDLIPFLASRSYIESLEIDSSPKFSNKLEHVYRKSSNGQWYLCDEFYESYKYYNFSKSKWEYCLISYPKMMMWDKIILNRVIFISLAVFILFTSLMR